ncbi:kinase-like protein [Coprinopsis marcescibilis]|uniref:Kinase-like protein n=1 Tax=Coprinopsis marcescibilis TaxID=230819 RepID=A0A5C3KGS6_COPMA|nr:kinase-like protein [Coprinopsis marcescibilis]
MCVQTAKPKRPVSEGHFGQVYKTKVQGTNESFALKVVKTYTAHEGDQTQTQRILKALAKEITIWGHLDDLHVLPLYGICEVEDSSWPLGMVSPWQESGNITHYLIHNPDVNRICLVADVASGVAYLHEQNIIHGDLKGMNILVTSSGHACLVDFGLASFANKEKLLSWSSLQSSRSSGGSLRWQAPECAICDSAPTSKSYMTVSSDIWAFACVCYEIMTGKLPFHECHTDGQVIGMLFRGKKPSIPPKTDDAFTKFGLTSQLWKYMTTCWAFDPESRPPARVILEWEVFRAANDVCRRPAFQWKVKETRFPLSESKVRGHLRL